MYIRTFAAVYTAARTDAYIYVFVFTLASIKLMRVSFNSYLRLPGWSALRVCDRNGETFALACNRFTRIHGHWTARRRGNFTGVVPQRRCQRRAHRFPYDQSEIQRNATINTVYSTPFLWICPILSMGKERPYFPKREFHCSSAMRKYLWKLYSPDPYPIIGLRDCNFRHLIFINAVHAKSTDTNAK